MSGYLLLKSSVILLISTGHLSHCVLSILTSQVIILPSEKYMFDYTIFVNLPAALWIVFACQRPCLFGIMRAFCYPVMVAQVASMLSLRILISSLLTLGSF